MISLRRGLLVVTVAAFVVVGLPSPASAHEFGPFAIDRYVGILAGPDGLEIDYVVDLAETPTQADGDRIERDPVGYCASLLDSIDLTVDGVTPDLVGPTAFTLRQDGDGGLTTLRIECGWT
ncbi:MAG: nickel transporter, partial [Actinomycetota bacterium]